MKFKLKRKKHEKAKHYVAGVKKTFKYDAELKAHSLETFDKKEQDILKKCKNIENVTDKKE